MNTNYQNRLGLGLNLRTLLLAGIWLVGVSILGTENPGSLLAQDENPAATDTEKPVEKAAQDPAAEAPAAEKSAEEKSGDEAPAEKPADEPAAEKPATEDAPAEKPADAPAADTPAEATPAADAPATDSATKEAAPAAETPAATTETPAAESPATETSSTKTAPAETSSDDPGETSTGQPIDPSEALKTEQPLTVQATEIAESMPAWKMLTIGVVVLALIIVPFVIGSALGNSLRMPDHGWKIGLILGTTLWGIVIVTLGWPPKLGPDLSGGINLIYEIDPRVEKKSDFTIDQMINALILRVNPGGVKEVTIRPYGPNQVEIIIPKAGEAELSSIKRQISTAGSLQFRITANYKDHEQLIQLAYETEGNDIREDDELLGHWSFIDLKRFDLVANSNDKDLARLIEQARATPGSAVGERNRVSAYWLELAPSEIPVEQRAGAVLRRTNRGALEVLLLSQMSNVSGGYILRADPQGRPQVLMAIDEFNVTGAMLDTAASNIDEHGRLAVGFTFKSSGTNLFAKLTTKYGPDSTGFHRHLGILLDDTLLSAPQLNEPITGGHGQISGNFTEDDINFLISILNAGSLPAALNKVPISEQTTSPELGIDTVRQGATAMIVSMIVVVGFMLIYYRFSGILACLALAGNILFTLAVMVSIKAAFTLPGLAGMVLTVGMAVDANVLIFERMREELANGTALRMAIRNGFERATTAIVDSNLTTLITAVVLYWIGTDQIKGFAVTLILGILTSMFTAIFCTRVVFEIAEKKRWVTEMRMMQFFTNANFNFMGKRFAMIGASIVLITVGLMAMFARGKNILDIDFVGGSSVTVQFQKPEKIAVVREQVNSAMSKLEGSIESVRQEAEKARPGIVTEATASLETDPAFHNKPKDEKDQLVNEEVARLMSLRYPELDVVVPVDVSVVGIGENELQYKIDTSIIDFTLAQRVLSEEFGNKLVRNHLEYKLGAPNAVSPASKPEPTSQIRRRTQPELSSTPLPGDNEFALAEEAQLALQAIDEASDAAPTTTAVPSDTPPAATEDSAASKETEAKTPAPAEPSTAEKPADTTPADSTKTAAPAETSDEPSAKSDTPTVMKSVDAAAPDVTTEFVLTFGQPINREAVSDLFLAAMESSEIPSASFEITSKDITYTEGSDLRLTSWNGNVGLNPEMTQKLLDSVAASVSKDPVFPSSSNIGGKVAGDTQVLAAYAMFISLIAIVAYIWFRFSSLMFGLAAVVALVHDVLVMLGMLALSYYIVQYLPFIATPLLIDPFKISLPIVAALLTVVGYSLNDTIVIFDRLREIRGKSPNLTADMMNVSVNQTLSRTTLTALTTFFVVVILYFMGGPGIHGFAYSLVIGVVAGTYSTIFIACPVLDWLLNYKSDSPKASKKSPAVAR